MCELGLGTVSQRELDSRIANADALFPLLHTTVTGSVQFVLEPNAYMHLLMLHCTLRHTVA